MLFSGLRACVLVRKLAVSKATPKQILKRQVRLERQVQHVWIQICKHTGACVVATHVYMSSVHHDSVTILCA